MKEPKRTQWQIRCAFNSFCKRVLKNEAINAHKERMLKKFREIPFSDLEPKDRECLYFDDKYFSDDNYKSFFMGGKEITIKQLTDALHNLPKNKKTVVLLYYFFDMSDKEIATILGVPRSTVQYRRTSSFKLLKQFLEGGICGNGNDKKD